MSECSLLHSTVLTDVCWYGTLNYITIALSFFSFSGEAISCVHVYELDRLQGDKNDHVNTFRQFTALSAVSATTWLCFYPGTYDRAVLFADSVDERLRTPKCTLRQRQLETIFSGSDNHVLSIHFYGFDGLCTFIFFNFKSKTNYEYMIPRHECETRKLTRIIIESERS